MPAAIKPESASPPRSASRSFGCSPKTVAGRPSIKQRIALAIGMPICRLRWLQRYKSYLLSTWTSPGRQNGIDGFFYRGVIAYWLRNEYLLEKDPDKRESLKDLLMGGASSAGWARHYDAQPLDFKTRVGHLSYEEACPVLPKIDRSLASATGTVVVQIGSSSGREIAWLAARHPRHEFIGTDIYPEVLAYSREHHRGPNLSFEKSSAKDVFRLIKKHRGRRMTLFSSGSLQYVQPEHLEGFFAAIGGVPGLELCLQEPANESAGSPDQLLGSLWLGNLAYTHNYRFYGEKAGFITQECRIIRPYFPYQDFPMHRNTVHYFYHAKTGAAL